MDIDKIEKSETIINDEFLPEPILIYRKLSAEELNKFVNGDVIKPNEDHDCSEVSSAEESCVYFSPENLEYVDKEESNSLKLGLANTGKKISDFTERNKIWLCGGMYAKNIIVEFSTQKTPKVRVGTYHALDNKPHYIKEYTYDEYSSQDFQIRVIYSVELNEILFNANEYLEKESRNVALKNLSDRLRAEEYDYAKNLDNERHTLAQAFIDHRDELPNGNG